MLRELLKSKIYYAQVTETELYYEGSITIDRALVKKAGLVEGERVEVLNVNNGARFQTYVIAGKENSGVICLNGPAARLGVVGDRVIILSYALFSDQELKGHTATYVVLNNGNKIKDILSK